MAVQTYTATGSKASVAAKLDKSIFEADVKNHELLKQAYVSYLANGRENLAQTKRRGEVSGGGRKPWRQKGTGRARFGSSRNPIWRGGGVAFGPTGSETYAHNMSTHAKRQAIRQALTTANEAGKISVIETFSCKEGKVKQTIKLLDKLGAKGSVLIVVSNKDELVDRATNNLPMVHAVQAQFINVYDVLNADTIIISQKSLDIIHTWLAKKPAKTATAKGGSTS
jgi:large subunit ribosomal protein L4